MVCGCRRPATRPRVRTRVPRKRRNRVVHDRPRYRMHRCGVAPALVRTRALLADTRVERLRVRSMMESPYARGTSSDVAACSLFSLARAASLSRALSLLLSIGVHPCLFLHAHVRAPTPCCCSTRAEPWVPRGAGLTGTGLQLVWCVCPRKDEDNSRMRKMCDWVAGGFFVCWIFWGMCGFYSPPPLHTHTLIRCCVGTRWRLQGANPAPRIREHVGCQHTRAAIPPGDRVRSIGWQIPFLRVRRRLL